MYMLNRININIKNIIIILLIENKIIKIVFTPDNTS